MTEQIHIRARKFLQEFFNDEELNTFCFDYFPQVFADFTQGTPKNQKVLMLVAYSQRRDRFDELLAALERERSKGYREKFTEKPRLVDIKPRADKVVKRNPRQIFISHASQDAEFAQRLGADLRAKGWETWMAPDNIRPGEKWVEAIDRGLLESGVFVLVLTPEAVNSRWVQSEMNVAIGLEHRGEIRLFPLNVKPNDSPALWGTYQWIAFDGGYEAGLEAFLEELEPKQVSQKTSPRTNQSLAQEESEEPEQGIGFDDGLKIKVKGEEQARPIHTYKPNRIQTLIAKVTKNPIRLLLGSIGIIFLFLIVYVFWPKLFVDSGNETTEIINLQKALTQSDLDLAASEATRTVTADALATAESSALLLDGELVRSQQEVDALAEQLDAAAQTLTTLGNELEAVLAQPPEIAILSPVNGRILPVGEVVNIVLVAAQPTGVASISLTINEVPIEISQPENETLFTVIASWLPDEADEYVIQLIAVNSEGISSPSATVTVTVALADTSNH